jgi:hypothetical protein
MHDEKLPACRNRLKAAARVEPLAQTCDETESKSQLFLYYLMYEVTFCRQYDPIAGRSLRRFAPFGSYAGLWS